MGDAEVLMYNGIVLRDSDLDILQGPCYLNDQIIGFYFSYLSSLYQSDDILLVPPSISFWLTNCQDDQTPVEEFVKPLKLSTKRLIFFTVNDSEDLDGAGSGTHWSILVYDRSKNAFLHHDSMKGVNQVYAMKLYEAIKGFVGPATSPSLSSTTRTKKKGAARSLPKSAPAPAPATAEPVFQESSTPQQTNGYDCGLYVLAIAKAICHWHLRGRKGKDVDWLSAIQRDVDASLEMTMRNEVLKLIEDLRKEELN